MISVIIPAYNEEKILPETIRRVEKSLRNYRHEIIVVDDGSEDRTSDVVRKIENIKLVSYRPNKGKGYAFRAGIKKSTGNTLVQIDADSQFMPEEITKLVKPILDKRTDITFGSRFLNDSELEDGSLTKFNEIANRVDSFLTSLFAGVKISDVQAGFKAFTRESIEKIDFKEDGFSYEPEIAILASKKNFRILDVPITYKRRKGGKSKIELFKDAFMITKTIVKTWLSEGV